MDSLLQMVERFDTGVYLIVFIYCFIRSGLLPFYAALAAALGYLDVRWVALASLLGGYLGDEARFFIARRYGHLIRFESERLQQIWSTASQLAQRYALGYIFMYRYPKGLKFIGALPVGLGDMPWGRFTLVNLASTFLWMNIVVGLGFVLGEPIKALIEQGWGLLSLVFLAAFVVLYFYLGRRLLAGAGQ